MHFVWEIEPSGTNGLCFIWISCYSWWLSFYRLCREGGIIPWSREIILAYYTNCRLVFTFVLLLTHYYVQIGAMLWFSVFCMLASTLCLILNCRRFVRRGFSECSIESIPEQRRKRINLSRGSKYYIKQLQPKPAGVNANNFVIRWLSTHRAWCHLRRYQLRLQQFCACPKA